MPTKINENPPTKTQKYKEPGDPRQNPNANKYGFQDMMVTRSGHTFVMNDVKDHEYISMQHRSGTGWIYNPDGSAKMTVFNGFYNDIRGEYRINTSGTFDVRSEVDASLRAEGNFDVTATSTNITSSDSTNLFTGDGFNLWGSGKINMVGKGFQVFSTSDGPINLSTSGAGIEMSGGNVTFSAREPNGGLATFQGQQVAIKAEQSTVAIGAKTCVSVSVEGGNVYIDAGGGNVYINSGPGMKPQNMQAAKVAANQSSTEVKNPLYSPL